MAVKSYVLVETEVGTAKAVADRLKELNDPGAKIVAVDTVTGPFDVITQLESDDLNKLGSYITAQIQTIPGVKRTTTCLTLILD